MTHSQTNCFSIARLHSRVRRHVNDHDATFSHPASTCCSDYKNQSTLLKYLNEQKISPSGFRAGMTFRNAYLRGVLHLKQTDSGSGSHGDKEMPAILSAYSAKLIDDAARVLSKAQTVLMIKICAFDQRAGDSYRLATFNRGLNALSSLWSF